MARLTAFAPAKINLCLHVTDRRPDGFHLLDSIAVFAGVGDTLWAEPADTLSLTVGGEFGAGLAAEPDNLVLRAARALAAAAGVRAGAKLHLDKHLPVASGIGGGSADAAATLRLLSKLWSIETDVVPIARDLGADVPVCLASRPARMRGIGDVLEPIDLPAFGLVLANPGVPVATKDVFARLAPPRSPELPAVCDTTLAGLLDWLATTTNDLQTPAIALCPHIAETLAALTALPECLLARMSGSGATCFAITTHPADARTAAARLKDHQCWSWGGDLARPMSSPLPLREGPGEG